MNVMDQIAVPGKQIRHMYGAPWFHFRLVEAAGVQTDISDVRLVCLAFWGLVADS